MTPQRAICVFAKGKLLIPQGQVQVGTWSHVIAGTVPLNFNFWSPEVGRCLILQTRFLGHVRASSLPWCHLVLPRGSAAGGVAAPGEFPLHASRSPQILKPAGSAGACGCGGAKKEAWGGCSWRRPRAQSKEAASEARLQKSLRWKGPGGRGGKQSAA